MNSEVAARIQQEINSDPQINGCLAEIEKIISLAPVKVAANQNGGIEIVSPMEALPPEMAECVAFYREVIEMKRAKIIERYAPTRLV
jgi:hypothetical protein